VVLEHLDGLRHFFGDALAEWRRRADDRQGLDPLRSARGEGAGDRAANLGADEVKPVDGEMVHQQAEILDQPVERPREIAWHRGRLAETAHIRAHYAKMLRQLGNPAPPGKPALRIAVQQQYGFRLGPRVGEIVDLIMHVEIG